ncbi:MAG: hypothetical protein WDM84_06500 [Bauldia sp.]
MTRFYANRGFWVRNALLILFLIVVFLYGCFELWRAFHVSSADSTTGITFGVVFAGGSLFAFRQLTDDHRDLVATLDRNDTTGELVAAVWKLAGAETIAAPPSAFTGWRVHVKTLGKVGRAYFLHVDAAGRQRPLRFDLKSGTDLAGLRQIAPDAIAEFEAQTRPAAKGA